MGLEAAGAPGFINLARVSPFGLGDLDVIPGRCEVACGAQSQKLEPRVMQVLVALAQAKGAIVARDDLLVRCWAGRIVGDNAIQRCISQLRDVAASIGGGGFRLETVPKVGYRLIEISTTVRKFEDHKTANGNPAVQLSHKRIWVAAGVAMLSAFLLLAVWYWIVLPAPLVVAIRARPGADILAHGVAADLARAADAKSISIAGKPTSRADYVIHIGEQKTGDGVRSDLSLANSHTLLWSAIIERTKDTTYLRQQITAELADVVLCALQRGAGAAHFTNSVGLFLSACERLRDFDAMPMSPAAVGTFQKLAAMEPDSAQALGLAALAEAQLARDAWQTNTGAHVSSLRSLAAADFARALSLDANADAAYAAKSLLAGPTDWGAQLSALDEGLSHDPNSALLYAYRVGVLENVGRMDDAIQNARRAVALDPNSPWYRAVLISALAYSGYSQSAFGELRSARSIWPDDPAIEEVASRLELRFGDPAALLRTIEAGNIVPNTSAEQARGMELMYLAARANPTPVNVGEAIKASLAFWDNGLRGPFFPLQTLSEFGRVDEAYLVLGNRSALAYLRLGDTDVLFRAGMRSIRLDPRFMDIASRLGLVRYWQASGVWPDFCEDAGLRYDCRREAKHLRHLAEAYTWKPAGTSHCFAVGDSCVQ